MARDPWDDFADAPGPAAQPAPANDAWADFADAPAPTKSKGLTNWALKANLAPLRVSPGAEPHDGDTFPIQGGNARLYGADAFELGQQGRNGAPADLGAMARANMLSRLAAGGIATPTGTVSYGRPVVTLNAGGRDAARDLIGDGAALPTPTFLASQPMRLDDYIAAQRDAIANERGAYAGQYQNPTDFRHLGKDAPWQGKTPMSPAQAADYRALVTSPFTAPATVADWARQQGQPMENAAGLLQFSQRTPTASLSPNFQQRDVTGAPVQPAGPNIATRTLGALNEGLLSDVIGAPIDLANSALGAIGLPVSSRPIGGSASISDLMHRAGIGQASDAYAPRSVGERYLQSVARGVGQAAIPVGGSLSLGARLAASTAPAALRAAGLRGIFGNIGREAIANPAMTIAGEVGGGVGAGAGGQYARDTFPGNPYADVVGQVMGGLGGGFAGGFAASRGLPVRNRLAEGAAAGVDSAEGEGINSGISPAPGNSTPGPIDPAAFSRQANAMFQAGASADDLRGFARDAGGYSLNGLDEAIAYRDRGGKGSGVASPQPSAAAMSDDISSPSISAPVDEWDQFPDAGSSLAPGGPAITARMPDRIDVWDQFPDAESFHWEDPVRGFSRGAGEVASPDQMAAVARGANPEDFRRLPANTVGSLDEAMQANPGTIRDVTAPLPETVLPSYRLGNANRRQPADLVAWLRSQGGVQDLGGDLRAMGVDNAARDFDRGEGFLGRLVNPDGLSLDDAAELATEAGFFQERPTTAEFLDAIEGTHRGANRIYRPGDYDTVASYQRAQDHYSAVQQARDEGSPLAQDVGLQASMADLDANQPPPVAYEDLERVASGRVGNIDLAKLEAPQDISRALAATDFRAGGFDAARRGVVSQNETRQLARELGMTPDDLLRRQRGQALNAEQALAARSILAKSGSELTNLAERAVGGSDVDKVAFRQGLLRHMAIQEQVSGATAEAGRALAQFRMAANSREVSGRVLKNLIDQAGGSDRLDEIAQGILEQRDPGQRAKFLRDATKPSWADKLLELRYNFMLSGPQTHAVNVLSNTMTAIGQLPEHAVAAGIGAARRAAGVGSTDRVLGSEIGSRAVGLINGLQEGLGQFARTLRTGEESDFFSKVESNRAEAIPGKLGFALRTPTRMLSAEDELFKAMARRMELAGLSTRKAYQEGLTGEAAKRRAGELLENPTDDMLKQAFEYGRYVTFQAPLGKFGQAVSNATNASPVAKLFVPFVRTPTNILKFAVERSPAAPILKEWRNDVAAGGARRDLALARTMIGSAVGAMAVQWAANGLITGGGPADESAKRLMRADGWQPYSLKIGDRYYSYQRLDPFSTTLGVAADMVDLRSHMTDKQREEVTSLLTASVMQSLSNKTWLSGLSDLAEAFKDPGRYGEGLAASLVTSMTVPALVSQTTRTVDPFMRDARTIMERVQSRIPVASRSLAMRRDVWGNPVISEGGVGPDMVSPIWTSTARNDPTTRSLLDAGVRLSMPSRTVAGIELTPEQYSAYQEAIGRQLRPQLEAITQSNQWKLMGRDDKQDLVSKVSRESRKRVRMGMFGGGR